MTKRVCEIFSRSIEKDSLKYGQFVRDGYTGSYGEVQDDAFGGKYLCSHERRMCCLVRLDSGLARGELKRKQSNMKQFDRKVIRGKGRPTDKTRYRMQNDFGEAIRNNLGNIFAIAT